ncbi:MurR/RpiR family transcriptional regulator [Halanaerobium salsuginis]|uniref:Transcriptional regulator, RpiR family n=1 Tax=Halanaerobium salsuginis TaxID=29563 RepID=A0A1I4JYI7_9FIRM|nr:MurR/RpiR family transcriptional regulator [Halanaerobium salsuginis]SFL71562.1 transcriptional regulator, RpiR family [Halanaerobium salsuginis]
MKVLLKIKNIYADLTATEKKIADYILANSQEAAELAVTELAQASQSSPASVVRFCKKIDYQGFQDFKFALVKNLSELDSADQQQIYDDIAVEDSLTEIMDKLAHDNIRVIENTVELLSAAELEAAVNALQTAENVYIFGIGASGLVAKDLQHKLMRVKKTVIYYSDTHAQLASAANIEAGDLAIAISYSGQSREVYKALTTAQKRGAQTISITKYSANPLAKISQIKLQVAGSEKNLRLGAITSRIAQLTAVDILFVAYARKNFAQITEYLKNTRDSVEEFKLN